MKRSMFVALLSASALLVSSQAMAKIEFTLSVPNTGANGGCMACHTSTTAGSVGWNTFGLDVLELLEDGQPNWAALCDLDSDGDGATNGLELADPECTWVAGDDNPEGEVTHPGDAESTPLGSGDPVTTDDPADAGGSGADTSDDPAANETDNASTSSGDNGGCQSGSSAPLAALALLFTLTMVLRRRIV